MVDIENLVRTPLERSQAIAQRMRSRRKAMKMSQTRLATVCGVSYASIRRFESTGQISLESLLAIAVALDCQDDFDRLFARRYYSSIQEVIDENNQ